MNGCQYSSWMLERLAIGDTVRLRFGTTSMGRHSSSAIRVLEAGFVSRHHAIIKVSNNDENVSVQDVSSNGIYVNERRYDKETIPLKSNDLIGFGVSPIMAEHDADVIKLPIYQLKYAPIKKIQAPSTSAANSDQLNANIIDRNLKQPISNSNNVKVETLGKVDEVFEISDEDDECDVLAKPTNKNFKTEMTQSSGIQKQLVTDLNEQIQQLVKNESTSPSQKCTESNTDEELLTLNKHIKDELLLSSSETTSSHKSNSERESAMEITSNQPETSMISMDKKERNQTLLHFPIISNVKKERLRLVSNDIRNIFGDIEGDVEMQKTIKEIDPLVFNEINASTNGELTNFKDKTLINGDYIVLTDDDELEGIELDDLGTILPNKETESEQIKKHQDKSTNVIQNPKSPNIFDSSLDNSKEEVSTVDESHNNIRKETSSPVDNIDLNEYIKYISNNDEEDIEDLMFSQVLINDMKAELQDNLNNQEDLPYSNTKNDHHVEATAAVKRNEVAIKQECGSKDFSQISKELEDSCWIISDDEDYDEELETKVNDWSNKIFSQSFNSFSQNMSQVYEIEDRSPVDVDEEDDCLAEENLNFLEDDFECIANIYNITEQHIDENVQSLKSKLNNIEVLHVNEIMNQAPEKSSGSKTIVDTENCDMQPANVAMDGIEVEQSKVLELNQPTASTSTITSSIKTSGHTNDIESPIVKLRRVKKTRRVIRSSSSSEDEFDTRDDKVIANEENPLNRQRPLVIEAPALPKHRGKLRGVSAEIKPNIESYSLKRTLASLKDKFQQERYSNEMKTKWLEKSNITKKRDKESKKIIKERRKDKLKEVAERKNRENIKRKLFTEAQERKAKVPKVKVTSHNRGAFLASNNPIPPPLVKNASKLEPINNFKIPKLSKNPVELKKPPPARSLSVDGFESFSQQISKPDILLYKRENSVAKQADKCSPSRRNSTTETIKPATSSNINATAASNAICKEAIAARALRTTNKITFASMEKNIVENEKNIRKLNALTAFNKDTNTEIKKLKNLKKVRFNDTPVIHYIERVSGACKKINHKDVLPLSTHKDRRNLIRTAYPIIDHTDRIISNILCWSNEWLINCNAAADAAIDVIYPMPQYFNSFDHYKSIVFPLMKLEFVSTLEREYNLTQNVKTFKVNLEYATPNQDRIMLITKFINNQNKELANSMLYDLVLLELDKRRPNIFAFVVANRKGSGSLATIVYEIIGTNLSVEYLKTIRELNVRPVMDKVRVYFGAFNSVYQLQSTPLFQKIINPQELLKCRLPPKKNVNYRGFDKLNDKQKQVLLNTYVKIIDESTPNITLIKGPPGTGKSRVIANLVLQTLYGEEVRYLDKKILVCAQSNAAVDVIAAKLYDISMRMRKEKRFRLIRYGMLNKMHPSVLPIALQKVIEHDQLKKLQAKNGHIQVDNKENLKNQILQFEAEVAAISSRNIKGTVEEDQLIEKKRQLQLMRNILNGNMRPEDERSLFTWYLSNANIVCATLSSCVNLSQYINFFDICVIDEATQCTEPWTLLPLKFGINSLVLVGDTQQLPATVLSKKANDLGLGTSMFTRIQRCLDNIPSTSIQGAKANVTLSSSIIYGLQTQYRMHPEICRWPNQYFYRNELINDKLTMKHHKSPLVPFSILSLTYTQNNAGVNGKITNNLEAEFVAKLLKALDGFIPNKYNSYGVITPYAHHRATLYSAIRNMGLTNIMVNTIDSYQGLEKDVIVISNARTNGIGFLSNPQRLNVALTRSKKCLILCGNFKNLESVPVWRCLLENARERKLYHEISANCMEDMQTNVIEKIKL